MLRKPVTAAVASLLLLAACGDGDDPIAVQAATPLEAVQQSRAAAADAGSARITMTVTMEVPGVDEPIDVTGDGAYDLDAQVAELTMDFGGLFEQLGAMGDEVPAGLDEPMRLVVDGDTAYVSVPFLTAFTGTSGWLSVDASELAGEGLGGGLGGLGAGADPGAILELLRGAGEVTDAGEEDLDGVATTRYDVTIDLREALAEVPEAHRAQLESVAADLDTLPLSVWIDDEGLPRQLVLDLDVDEAAVAMTMQWSGYGEPVEVEVPDPSEVTPADDLLGDLGGSFLGAA